MFRRCVSKVACIVGIKQELKVGPVPRLNHRCFRKRNLRRRRQAEHRRTARRVLDQALQDAGVKGNSAFVTNAVKHFKHETRGKRRLHKRPDHYEIERCKIWLDLERRLVKPDTIIALGVTAARSLTGHTLPISKVRGKPIAMADGTRLIVTIHPSALLRIGDYRRHGRADARPLGHESGSGE
jgi:uracil-DNA glycosylase family 4